MCTHSSLDTRARRVSTFIAGTHAWMCFGLAITGAIAFKLSQHAETMKWIYTSGWIWGLIFAQFALIIAIGLSKATEGVAAFAGLLFVIFSALEGVLVSSIFARYPIATIGLAFGITAGTFAGMSLYGYITKNDLTSVGSIGIMAVWGLILAMLVNAFMQSPLMDYVISSVAVVVFCGLTAYDTQKLVELARDVDDDESLSVYAVQGALTLYLDFMNLFLHILRLFGGSKK